MQAQQACLRNQQKTRTIILKTKRKSYLYGLHLLPNPKNKSIKGIKVFREYNYSGNKSIQGRKYSGNTSIQEIKVLRE